ncbi:MAG: ras-related protein rab-18-like protein, partial [Olpidium bornovanus]
RLRRKSSLLLRFTEDQFDSEVNATIGVDFKVKNMEIDGVTYKLTIWVCAQKTIMLSTSAAFASPPASFFFAPPESGKFNGKSRRHYPVCELRSFSTARTQNFLGWMRIYRAYLSKDTAGQERFRTLTSSYYRGAQGTFTHLEQWFNELTTYASSRDVVIMVVGNKIDQESDRQVSRQEGVDFARKLQTLFIESSAKTRVGVKQTFEELVQKIADTPSIWKRQPVPSGARSVNFATEAAPATGGACAC